MEKKMTEQAAKTLLAGEKYVHPDGTVFTRNQWGLWNGTDGSQVSDAYVAFRTLRDSGN